MRLRAWNGAQRTGVGGIVELPGLSSAPTEVTSHAFHDQFLFIVSSVLPPRSCQKLVMNLVLNFCTSAPLICM